MASNLVAGTGIISFLGNEMGLEGWLYKESHHNFLDLLNFGIWCFKFLKGVWIHFVLGQ
jgi:hypothetical protein